VTSKPDFKVMVLLLVFMQLTRDLFAIAKFLFNSHIRVTISSIQFTLTNIPSEFRSLAFLRCLPSLPEHCQSAQQTRMLQSSKNALKTNNFNNQYKQQMDIQL